jgi:methylenetetrahydrofolate reductase (NADPH)
MGVDISLEIVPRSAASVREDVRVCRSCPGITSVNIPDLTRFSLRSWEACAAACEQTPSGVRHTRLPVSAFIPHLRARDFSLDAPFPHVDFFRRYGIKRALVISGDADEEETAPGSRPWDASAAIACIKKLRAEMPELEIYAAFDPYRTNIRYELDYLALKEEAGAAGFMSQPFFDLRLLEIYSEYLEGKRIFWGVAPVLSSGSRNYWESRNRTVFPKSFRAELDWNAAFGKSVLNFCEKNNFSLYLMPVKLDLQTYLSRLFSG